MELPRNALKHALAEGRTQIGMWCCLCSPVVVELLGTCGFDWMLLDGEHAPNEVPDVQAQLQALSGSPTSPVVRAAWNDPVLIKRLLDIGAQSLLIPYVQSADEARRAVAATRYPPRGIRGVSMNQRANRWGAVETYHRRADSEIAVLVQVETRGALDHIDEIAAVEGVDGIFIGPSDLSAGIGHLADATHPEALAAIRHGAERCKALGKPAGIIGLSEADLARYFEMGFSFVAVGMDQAILANQGRALAKRYKGA